MRKKNLNVKMEQSDIDQLGKLAKRSGYKTRSDFIRTQLQEQLNGKTKIMSKKTRDSKGRFAKKSDDLNNDGIVHGEEKDFKALKEKVDAFLFSIWLRIALASLIGFVLLFEKNFFYSGIAFGFAAREFLLAFKK